MTIGLDTTTIAKSLKDEDRTIHTHTHTQKLQLREILRKFQNRVNFFFHLQSNNHEDKEDQEEAMAENHTARPSCFGDQHINQGSS